MRLTMTRSVVLVAFLLCASLSLVTVLSSCDNANNPSLVGCGADASVTIGALGVPTPATSSVLISGSVTGAPCGVQGLSVLGAYSASPALSGYATWSASVPLGVLESQNSCIGSGAAGADAGVLVSAQALVIGDPGTAPRSIGTTSCVGLPAFGSGLTCGPPPATGDAGCAPGPADASWTCGMPLGAGAGPGVELDVYTSASLIGRAATWKSGSGATVVQSRSPIVANASASFVNSAPDAGCCTTVTAGCVGKASALVTAGGAAGLDVVTVAIDGVPTVAAYWTIAVQGPAQVTASPSTLRWGDTVDVEVRNTFRFTQTCQLVLAPGTAVSGAASGSCAIPDAGMAPTDCSITPAVFDNAVQHFTISTISGPALDASAPTGQVTLVCTDQFGQIATVSVGLGASSGSGMGSGDGGSG